MFQTSRTTRHLLSSCVGVVLAFAGTVHAQDSSTQQSTTTVDLPPPGTSTIELPRPQDFEVGIFAGGNFFKQKTDALQTEFMPSGLAGGYIGENPTAYIGFEQSFAYSQNAVRFHQNFGGEIQSLTLDQKLLNFQDKVVIHFTPKTSAFRPYVAAGFGLISFRPTDTARSLVSANPTIFPNGGFGSVEKFDFTYGGGLKVRISEHFGLRAEAIGILARLPHYGLPPSGISPQAYIPSGGILNGLQIDTGIYYAFGGKQTIVLPVQRPWTGVSIAASGNNVCPGAPITIKATINGRQTFAVPNYRWQLDGKDAGSNSDTLTLPTDSAGVHQVALTVVDSGTLAKSVVPAISITINAHTPPTITANADKTDLQVGDKATLYPHPLAGSCPGTLTVTWAASEGSVTGSDPATYDSTGVQVDPGQTKQVTATATVTDSAGGTASAPVTLTVSRKVEFQRQDDIIFPTGNSRVNNCGKRILIDQVYPALTSGQYSNYDVVLVGHEGNEPPPAVKGRRGRRAAAAPAPGTLATERAQHAAEILASGEGICPKPGIDVSRIKIATVGPNQGAEFRKPICAASIKERRASQINGSDDQLKDQRVEIWFVPKGSNLPPSAQNAQPAPDSVKTVCPK